MLVFVSAEEFLVTGLNKRQKTENKRTQINETDEMRRKREEREIKDRTDHGIRKREKVRMIVCVTQRKRNELKTRPVCMREREIECVCVGVRASSNK